MRVFETIVQWNLSTYRKNRISLSRRGGQSRDQIRHTWSRGGNTNTDATSEPPHGLSHERRILLMPAENQLDGGIQQCIENAVDLGSRDTKHMGDAMLFKRLDQKSSSIHQLQWSSMTLRTSSPSLQQPPQHFPQKGGSAKPAIPQMGRHKKAPAVAGALSCSAGG